MTLATNVNNGNLSTRAGGEGDGSTDTDETVNEIGSLALALFTVKDGRPDQLMQLDTQPGLSTENNSGKIIPTAQDGEANGYYLKPIKFKVTPDKDGKVQVAVVVLANYGTLFTDENTAADLAQVKTFDKFKEFTDLKMSTSYGVLYMNMDGVERPLPDDKEDPYYTPQYPILYPMSSNVCIIDITPGAINTVGYNKPANGLAIAKDYYKDEIPSEIVASPSQLKMIELYRGAAEVELKSLTFQNYGDQVFDHFILEDVFMMNVPTMVNWFASVDESYAWGVELNMAWDAYSSKVFDNILLAKNSKSFLTGNGRIDKFGGNGAIPFVPGEFCSQTMMDYTSFYGLLHFPHNEENWRVGAVDSKMSYIDETAGSNGNYGQFNEAKTYEMTLDTKGDSKDKYEAIKFAVAPSEYSLVEGKLDMSRAICLVVRGRYYYKSGGVVVGPDVNDRTASKCYTVVVNKEGESSTISGVPSHVNCVKRNTRYEISLTINGPGSETSWGYDKNSYVVPKVKIVPFGVVEQNSKLD